MTSKMRGEEGRRSIYTDYHTALRAESPVRSGGVGNGNPISFFRRTKGNLWKLPQRNGRGRGRCRTNPGQAKRWRGRRRGEMALGGGGRRNFRGDCIERTGKVSSLSSVLAPFWRKKWRPTGYRDVQNRRLQLSPTCMKKPA